MIGLVPSDSMQFDRMIIISDLYDTSEGRCCVIFFKSARETDDALRWFKTWNLIVKGSLVAVRAPSFRDAFFGKSDDLAIIGNVRTKDIIPLNDEKMKYIWGIQGKKLDIRTGASFVSTRRFVFQRVYVKMNHITILHSCGGIMCDRAAFKTNGSCFCTEKDSPRNIVLCGDATLFRTSACKFEDKICDCYDFQSLRFSEMICGKIRLFKQSVDSLLEEIDNSGFQLCTKVNNYLEAVNISGGFIAVGWYKIGSKSDSSTGTTATGVVDDSKDIIADRVNPHLVRLIPNLNTEDLPEPVSLPINHNT